MHIIDDFDREKGIIIIHFASEVREEDEHKNKNKVQKKSSNRNIKLSVPVSSADADDDDGCIKGALHRGSFIICV